MSQVLPIEENPRCQISTAAEGQTEFPVNFPFQANADIVVVKIADGVETVLEEAEHYTLTGAGAAAGGTITLVEPAEAGWQILRYGQVVLDRLSSIAQAGKFSSRATDDDLDRAILALQEVRRDLGRALMVRLGEAAGAVAPGAPGEVPLWDGNGGLTGGGPNASQIANASASAAVAVAAAGAAANSAGVAEHARDEALAAVSEVLRPFVSIAAAQAYNPDVAPDYIRLEGYTSAGDGGGALYRRALSEPPHEGKLQTADGTWWEIVSVNGAVNLRQFGAVPITDWTDPADSTAALARWAGFVTHMGGQVRTVVDCFVKCTTSLSITAGTICLTGIEASQSGFFFSGTDGFVLSQPTVYDGIVLSDLGFLTDGDETYDAIIYSSASATGSNAQRALIRSAFMGFDRFVAIKTGASLGRGNGWKIAFGGTQGDGFYIEKPLVLGPSGNMTGGFAVETYGIKLDHSTYVHVVDPQMFWVHTGIYLGDTTSENLHISGGELVAVWNGVVCKFNSGSTSSMKISQLHVAAYSCCIDLGSLGSLETNFGNIDQCLLFTRSGGEVVQSGFTFIKSRGQVKITDTDFLVSSGIDTVTYSIIGIDIVSGKGTQILGNRSSRLGVFVNIRSGASHTWIDGNLTSDDSVSLAVDPLADAGVATKIGVNVGDRGAKWNNSAYVEEIWSPDAELAFYVGGSTKRKALRLLNASSGINSLVLVPSATGAPVQMYPEGTDADIGIQALPKGSGRFLTRRLNNIPGSAAPTLDVNGQMSFALTSNTTLVVYARGSDGITRSATLTLS